MMTNHAQAFDDQLLDNHFLFHTGDLNEAQEKIQQVFCNHRLRTVDGSQSVNTSFHYAEFGNAAFSLLDYGTSMFVETESSGDCFLISIPLSGRLTMRTGDEMVISSPGLAAVTDLKTHMQLQSSERCQQLVIKIDRLTLERFLEFQCNQPVTEPIVFAPQFNLKGEAGQSFMQTARYIAQQLQNETGMGSTAVGLAQLEQLLMCALLSNHKHNYFGMFSNSWQKSLPPLLQKATDYIQENIQHSIDVGSIAEHICVSERKLYKLFQQNLRTTPIKYLKGQRLDAIHRALLNPSARDNVTSIAMSRGITQLGRFSAEYKRRFGQSPSETLRSARDHCMMK